MVATCPLYQSVRIEICRCAGAWVHCSSLALALPPKVFTLMQFYAIYVSSMPAHMTHAHWSLFTKQLQTNVAKFKATVWQEA